MKSTDTFEDHLNRSAHFSHRNEQSSTRGSFQSHCLCAHFLIAGVKNQGQEAVLRVIAYVLTLIAGVKNQAQVVPGFLVALLKKVILRIYRFVVITLLLALKIVLFPFRCVSFIWTLFIGILKRSKNLAQKLILYAVLRVRDIVKSIFQRLVLNVLGKVIQHILRRFQFLQTVWNNVLSLCGSNNGYMKLGESYITGILRQRRKQHPVLASVYLFVTFRQSLSKHSYMQSTTLCTR